MIQVGSIVRYSPEWSTQEERKLLHVVIEQRFIPGIDSREKWLIETLGGDSFIHHMETVDGYMIEETGFTVQEAIKQITERG